MKHLYYLTFILPFFLVLSICAKQKQSQMQFSSPESYREPHFEDVDPKVRHDTTLTILTKICSNAINDTVVFFFDSSSFDKINTSIGENMFLGMIIKTFSPSLLNINKDSDLFKSVEKDRWAASTCYEIFGQAKSLDSMFQGAEIWRVPLVVIKDSDIRIEMEFFESDIEPNGRPWNPRSEKFKLLWTDTLFARDFFAVSDSTSDLN